VAFTCADWRELIAQPLDAVFILTSGSHAPIAVAAAQAGRHILVEKPMCFSVAEGQDMLAAAERHNVTLMVAYNKRYDPAYRRFVADARNMRDIRLARITTLEAPMAPYVGHHRLHASGALPEATRAGFAADEAARIAAAIGDVDPLSARAYRQVLLDSLVHEFNAVRGVLGEPDRLEFADITESGVTAVMRFGTTQCVLSWVNLPELGRYSMEFAFFAPDARLTLGFPSPYLRSAPTLLTREGGEPNSPHSWQTQDISSYQESFREELLHFHACVTEGSTPLTSASDALHDIALCQSVVEVHRTRQPRDRPSAWSAASVQA
jgi:predicted dehydrogenase